MRLVAPSRTTEPNVVLERLIYETTTGLDSCREREEGRTFRARCNRRKSSGRSFLYVLAISIIIKEPYEAGNVATEALVDDESAVVMIARRRLHRKSNFWFAAYLNFSELTVLYKTSIAMESSDENVFEFEGSRYHE
jgi:hypothetical protein